MQAQVASDEQARWGKHYEGKIVSICKINIMIRTIHINLRSYARMSNANFKLAFESIISALTNNSHFLSPRPSLNELRANLDKFTALAAAVEAKNLSLKSERDLARNTLLLQLQALSAYCQYTAMHSSSSTQEAIVKIQSAKLVIGQQGGYSKGRPLPAPGNLRSKSFSQAVEIRFSAVKHATGYLIRKTIGLPHEASKWTDTFSLHTTNVLHNLSPGQVITCVIIPLGTAGQGQPSGFISQVAGL